jgi:hypothetical protein
MVTIPSIIHVVIFLRRVEIVILLMVLLIVVKISVTGRIVGLLPRCDPAPFIVIVTAITMTHGKI